MATGRHALVQHVIGAKELFDGERCDDRRCKVEARLQVNLEVGGTLWFCGHHANAQAEQLIKAAESMVVHPDFVNWRAYRSITI